MIRIGGQVKTEQRPILIIHCLILCLCHCVCLCVSVGGQVKTGQYPIPIIHCLVTGSKRQTRHNAKSKKAKPNGCFAKGLCTEIYTPCFVQNCEILRHAGLILVPSTSKPENIKHLLLLTQASQQDSFKISRRNTFLFLN